MMTHLVGRDDLRSLTLVKTGAIHAVVEVVIGREADLEQGGAAGAAHHFLD